MSKAPKTISNKKTCCSVDGCDNNVFCKGFCNSHYNKNRLYGTPKGNPRIPKGYIDDLGYRAISINGKRIREHILVAEKALGRKLPKGVSVHHVDENKTNNNGNNLVICQNEAYHQLLHRRKRALDESGDANNRQCTFCKKWSNEKLIKVNKANSCAYHSECRNANRRKLYKTKMRELQ